MKRVTYSALALCAALLTLLPACRRGPGPGEIELPGTLEVKAELPGEYPGEAAAYNLEWYDPNGQTVIDNFMRSEPQERQEQANGTIFRAKNDGAYEYLFVLNGESYGGFSYSLHTYDLEEPGEELSEGLNKDDLLTLFLRRQQP